MTEARPPSADPAPALPWRKRHPRLSRSILYSLGLGLAVLLLVLLTQRRGVDLADQRAALEAELDSLGLVLAADPRGDSVRAILDEKYADPGLPVFLRGRVERWRAMAWRAQAGLARQEGDETALHTATAAAETALRACADLDLEPAERVALGLEWAEARLEREDPAGAAEVLPAAERLETLPQMLLHTLLRAQIQRLGGDADGAVQLARSTLGALPSPLDAQATSYVGGRSWNAVQVATELAGFVTTVGRSAADGDLWRRLRASAPRDFPLQTAAARALAALGRGDDALLAWRAARTLDARLAAAESRADPALQALDERLTRQ